MSAPKFSPGEWRAEWLDHFHGWVMNEQGDYLCEIVVNDKEGKFVTPEQQKANAVLMARAPRLLEAVQIAYDDAVERGDPDLESILKEEIEKAGGPR